MNTVDVESFSSNSELYNYMYDNGLLKPANGMNEMQIFNIFIKMSNSMGLKLSKEQLFYGLNSNRLIMCSAGAGSGKTTTTNLKVINLTAIQGFNPRRVAFISFSSTSVSDIEENYKRLLNQANMYLKKFNTNEMRANGHELGCEYLPNIRSLNSLTYNILDQFKSRFGLAHVDIIKTEDSHNYMRSTLQAFKKDKVITGFTDNAVKWLIELYDYCNETLLTPIDLAHSEKLVKLGIGADVVQKILDSYRTKLEISGTLHHSDTCRMIVDKAKEDKEFAHILTEIYDAIIVDEYQDISESVYQLLNFMSGDKNIHWAVGDGNQSIYSFKGSRMNNCERFVEEHPGASLCYLTYNRRCREEIIQYANCVLEGIPTKINNKIRSIKDGGVVNIHEYSDKFQVLNELVDRLKTVPKSKLSEICIGYRRNMSCYYIVNLLTMAGVPFRIKDDYLPGNDKLSITLEGILALLRSPSNYRVIAENLYRVAGINKTMPKPDGKPNERIPIDFEEIMDEYDVEYFYEIPLEALPLRSSIETVKAEFEMLEELSNKIKSKGKLCDIIPGVMELLRKNFWNYTASVLEFPKDLEDLVISDYSRDMTFIQFKEYKMKLEEDIQRYVSRGYGVQLSTFHSLKGLEYEEVNLIELEGGIMPLLSITSDATEEEILENLYEELRLFYVACTRAKDTLNLYWDIKSPSAFISINDLYITNKAERIGAFDSNLDKVLDSNISNTPVDKATTTDTEIEELLSSSDLFSDGDLFDGGDINELESLINGFDDDLFSESVPDDGEDKIDEDVIDITSYNEVEVEVDNTVEENSVKESEVYKGLNAEELLKKARDSSASSPKEQQEDIPEYIAEDVEELEFSSVEGFVDVNEGDILANVIKLVCDIVEV